MHHGNEEKMSAFSTIRTIDIIRLSVLYCSKKVVNMGLRRNYRGYTIVCCQKICNLGFLVKKKRRRKEDY